MIYVLGLRFAKKTSGGAMDGSPDEVVLRRSVVAEYAPHENFGLWWCLQLPKVSPPPHSVLGFKLYTERDVPFLR